MIVGVDCSTLTSHETLSTMVEIIFNNSELLFSYSLITNKKIHVFFFLKYI